MKTISVPLIVLLLAVTAAGAQDVVKAPVVAPPTINLQGSARASKLIGTNIYQGDASIGQIEDILIDLDHGTLTAVILSVGGFLGIGEKLVAVPSSEIQVSSEARFTSNLTKAQLTNLPAFDYGKVRQ